MFKNITKIKRRNNNLNKGFTLVEAMFAIFILTFVIVGLMGVVSSSLYSSRYAEQEIVINFLMQEMADSIRNDRDNKVFFGDLGWDGFVLDYSNKCENGCILKIKPGDNPEIEQCSSIEDGCAIVYLDGVDEDVDLIYHYGESQNSKDTGIKRIFKASVNSVELPGYVVFDEETGEPKTTILSSPYKELKIEIIVSWLGKERTLNFSLLDWRQQ